MKATTRFAALILAIASWISSAQAGITYYHNDLAGSPVVAADATRHILWRESYRPYGERTVNSAAAVTNNVWFTSRRQDAETGLVYMGARYYDPLTGRFVAMDPKGFDGTNTHSHNRYAYGNDNPYRYSDPSGRTPIDIGFAVYDYGNLLGAYAAYGVGIAKGDLTLQNIAIEGMREARLDAGISTGAMVLPVSAAMLKGVARSAEELAEFAKLQKSLASEAQMAELGKPIAGPGTDTVFKEADRVAAQHGGSAEDWIKMKSSTFAAKDGSKIQTGWVENRLTSERVEFKSIVAP